MEKSKIMQTLESLGVKPQARDNKAYTFRANGLMPLYVETWRKKDGSLKVSLCHYGTQNGDMMRDPEIVFNVNDNKITPISFQNDYVGVITKPKTDFEKKDLLSFLDTWSDNIMQSEYK